MSSAFVQLPLVRLVDLAISTQEGAVNFHLLQALLHALIQKANAQTLAVELHGAEAAKLQEQLKNAPEKPTYSIKETVDKSKQGKDQEIYVMVPETAYTGSSSVCKEKMDSLEAELNDLKNQIIELRDLPGNLGIIEAVKNFDEKTSTVIDVFHMLSQQKRIEAVEEGMVKVASIVEDLIKSPGVNLETKNIVCQKEDENSVAENAASASAGSAVDSVRGSSLRGSAGSVLTAAASASKITTKRGKSGSSVVVDKAAATTGAPTTAAATATGVSAPEGGDVDAATALALCRQLARDVEEIMVRLKMKKRKSVESIPVSGGLATTEETVEEERDLTSINEYDVGLADERLKELAENMERLDVTMNEEISRLHNQFTDLEKDFNELLNKFELGAATGDADEPNACCSAVYQKLVQLESDFADINETSGKLLDDKEEKSKLMDFLVEQIEALKTGKADREAIEEALADKADACTVLRKVSHDQFDNAYEELSKGVGEALEKLTNQELLWQQALEDIQNEIGNKLDKMDLGPLREFINNKLRLLQDKIKGLAELKREQEAAGTKNKLLRDVNCISCDKEVVMQKEFDLSFRPMAPSYPANRSIAPYLAYELDALRRQQKATPEGKNLLSFEQAMAGRSQKKADDHICNRYCGGSHTITTPTQRVTRLGHFLSQWGPEAQPAISEKKSSVQRITSAEKAAEAGNVSPKLLTGSKTDQSKRSSKVSQGSKLKVTETGSALEEPSSKRSSQDSKGKSSSIGSGSIERRRSSTRRKASATKAKDGSRMSKLQVEPIPEGNEEGEEGSMEGKADVESPPGETAAAEGAEGEKGPSPTPASEAPESPQDSDLDVVGEAPPQQDAEE